MSRVIRKAIRAAAAGLCLLSLLLSAGACLLWARADGTHRDRAAVAAPGRYASVAWFQDGITVVTVADWPGTWDAWVGPTPTAGTAFKIVELRPWERFGGRVGGLAGRVRVALGPDGRPVASPPGAAVLAWDAGEPSRPLPIVQASRIPHWWPAALFAVPPAAWAVLLHRRRRRGGRERPDGPEGVKA